MNIEDFKKDIEDKYIAEINKLKRSISVKDQAIADLRGQLSITQKAGQNVYKNAREFRSKLESFIENEIYSLPMMDPAWDEDARILNILEDNDK